MRRTLALVACALVLINAADAGKRRRSSRKNAAASSVPSDAVSAHAAEGSVMAAAGMPAANTDDWDISDFTEADDASKQNAHDGIATKRTHMDGADEGDTDDYDIVPSPQSQARSSPVIVARDEIEKAARDVMSWPSSPDAVPNVLSPDVRSLSSSEDGAVAETAVKAVPAAFDNSAVLSPQTDIAQWQALDSEDGDALGETANEITLPDGVADREVPVPRSTSETESNLSVPDAPFVSLAGNPFSDSSDALEAAEERPLSYNSGLIGSIGESVEDAGRLGSGSAEMTGSHSDGSGEDASAYSASKAIRSRGTGSGEDATTDNASSAVTSIPESEGSNASDGISSRDSKLDMSSSAESRGPGSPWNHEVHRVLSSINTGDSVPSSPMAAEELTTAEDVSRAMAEAEVLMHLATFRAALATAEAEEARAAMISAEVETALNTVCSLVAEAVSRAHQDAPNVAPGYRLLADVAGCSETPQPSAPSAHTPKGSLSARLMRGRKTRKDSLYEEQRASITSAKALTSDQHTPETFIDITAIGPASANQSSPSPRKQHHAVHFSSDVEVVSGRGDDLDEYIPRQTSDPGPQRRSSFDRARAHIRVATAEIEAELDDIMASMRVFFRREIVEPLIAFVSHIHAIIRERQKRRRHRV